MKKQIEQRLILFSGDVINISNKLINHKAATYLYDQVMRSASSCALNYGEAQSAESKKDFTHKISLVLKELRETYINLNILNSSDLTKENNDLNDTIKENSELIAIFTKTLQTIKGKDNA